MCPDELVHQKHFGDRRERASSTAGHIVPSSLWAVERPNHSKNGCLRGCPRAATCRFMERRPRTPSPGHINQRCARSTPYSESENDRKPEVPRFIYPLDIAKDTTLDVTVVTTRAHRATACTQHPRIRKPGQAWNAKHRAARRLATYFLFYRFAT